jgi:hypothetical protein
MTVPLLQAANAKSDASKGGKIINAYVYSSSLGCDVDFLLSLFVLSSYGQEEVTLNLGCGFLEICASQSRMHRITRCVSFF